MQHFPTKNEVVISIADFGRGIPDTVRLVEPSLDDATAIVRAVQNGFSSKQKPSRRGAGLDFLIETVVKTNGGKIGIFSNSGHVVFFKDGDVIRAERQTSLGFCPGVTFDVALRTDTLELIEDEPEVLEW